MRGALVLVFLVACSRREHASSDAGPASFTPVVLIAGDAAPTPEAAPPPRSDHASVAVFEGDELRQCADVEIALAPGAKVDAGGKANLAEAFLTAQRKGAPKPTLITKPCAEQFADRPALATCTIAENDPDAGSLAFAEYYYHYPDVGMSDAEMKDCLEHRGDWKAIPRTSPAWHAAKLEYDSKKARELLGR